MTASVDPKVLEEYVLTANSGKYKSWDEINSKFPELKGYDSKVLEEYVTTANSGKYKSWDEINSKFPEFKLGSTPQPKPLAFGSELPFAPTPATQPTPLKPTPQAPVVVEQPKSETPFLKAYQEEQAVQNKRADERIGVQRQKLDLLNAENEIKKQRIEKIQRVKDLGDAGQKLVGEVEELSNIIKSGQYDQATYNIYTQKYNQLEDIQKQLQTESDEVSKLYEASSVMQAGLRNIDAKYQNVLKQQFDVGQKAKTALMQTRDNIVSSTGRIIETIGDIKFGLANTVIGMEDNDSKPSDIAAREIDNYAKELSKATDAVLPQEYKTYSPIADKFDGDKFLYFGMNSTAQLAPTIAAGIATGGAGAAMMGFTMEFGGLYDTFHEPIKKRYIEQGKSPEEAERLSDLEAGLMATGGATIIGQLDRFGASGMIDAFTKKALLKKYAKDALEGMAGKVGKDIAEQSMKKSLTQVVKDFGAGYGKAVLPEVIGEPVQELVGATEADVYDTLTGEDNFKESLGNKQTWIDAGNAGIGALLASSSGGIGAAYKNIANPTNYEMAMNVRDEDTACKRLR